ncbi:electron transfer flavoprotein subunit alpha/FixB family protein [Aeromicrobium sp. CTD01-1L150]|uniref:electron transfer flavoprotein subunit alpha/FixB family protein n=1 Tax=Aeromicrobium sp. CTD01-1L150 TaxID=3341830 RepID=UPI0035C1B8EB
MIVVLCEVDAVSGEADEVSLEALAAARSLGPTAALVAAVVGPVRDTQALGATLAAHGATQVHHLGGDQVEAFGGAAWASALADLRVHLGADVVLAGGTARGNEVMAHLATSLDVPMAANVVALAAQDTAGSGTVPLVAHRQVAGGSAVEEMRLGESPAVLTVAGHAWQPDPLPDAAEASWTAWEPKVSDADRVAQVVRTSEPEPDESQALTAAKVVVGAGRGAGGPDGFGAVSELAELLGGAVGVTRVVTSLGWRPHHEQVGQTGSRIAPDVYIACGISGAIQHWAGCASSRTIIAINTDPEAPMMTRAHYAVVGDMHEVVPAIVDELRAR